MNNVPSRFAEIIKKYPKLDTIQNEDVIDITLVPLTPEQAEAEIQDAQDHLQLNQQPVNEMVIDMPIDAFTFLYQQANLLRTDNTNYVTGMRLNLAVNEGAVTLIYQPVCMKRLVSSQTGEQTYNVHEGLFYVYDANETNYFRQATSTELTWIVNYQDNIRIKHYGSTTFDPFVEGVDTESLIFPFQTVLALVTDNPRCESVRFFNAIRQVPIEDSAYSIKHCVILGPDTLMGGPLTNKYANRSHLCPPSCRLVQYTVSSVQQVQGIAE